MDGPERPLKAQREELGNSRSGAPLLDDSTITLTPERTAAVWSDLSRRVKPEAVAGLQALVPNQAVPWTLTPALREKISKHVLSNLKSSKDTFVLSETALQSAGSKQ